MKVLGADLLAFYEAWPMGPDWYHDGGDAEAGVETLVGINPTAKYDLEGALGVILWQGRGDVPACIEINGKRVGTKVSDWSYEVSLPALFRAWKSTTTISAVVTLEGEHEAALREFVAARGGKIRS